MFSQTFTTIVGADGDVPDPQLAAAIETVAGRVQPELPNVFVSNTVGSLVAQGSITAGTIELDSTLTIEKRILDPDDYLSLRDLGIELHRASNRSL